MFESPEAFARANDLSTAALCHELVDAEDTPITVRNRDVAAANLARIVEATLQLANRSGFAAMTLRQLAAASGLSPGGLYAYIGTKDELARLIQHQIGQTLRAVTQRSLAGVEAPDRRLTVALHSHLYTTEALREWFFFLYMEAHHLATEERREAVAMEQASESVFATILRAGQREGVYRDFDADVAAGLIKAWLQDWYLKRGKHVARGLDVSAYATLVVDAVERFVSSQQDSRGEP